MDKASSFNEIFAGHLVMAIVYDDGDQKNLGLVRVVCAEPFGIIFDGTDEYLEKRGSLPTFFPWSEIVTIFKPNKAMMEDIKAHDKLIENMEGEDPGKVKEAMAEMLAKRNHQDVTL